MEVLDGRRSSALGRRIPPASQAATRATSGTTTVSQLDLGRGLKSDASAFFVECLPAQQIPPCTRLDTQWRRRFAERLELSLVRQDLVRNHRPESNDAFNDPEFIRSHEQCLVYAKLTWRFQRNLCQVQWQV